VKRLLFRGPVETGLVIGLLYLLLAGGILASERHSERNKIARGEHTIGQPFSVSRAAAWPVEPVVTDTWRGYPVDFNEQNYRALADHEAKQVLGALLLEACLIALVVGAVGMALRSVRHSRRSGV